MEANASDATKRGQDSELAALGEALNLMKNDTSKLLRDLLKGISMWGFTSLMAFLLAAVWLAFSQVVLTYAHPYGSPPQVLEILYAGYALTAISAMLGVLLSWRYYSLRKRYTRLFEIADKLR